MTTREPGQGPKYPLEKLKEGSVSSRVEQIIGDGAPMVAVADELIGAAARLSRGEDGQPLSIEDTNALIQEIAPSEGNPSLRSDFLTRDHGLRRSLLVATDHFGDDFPFSLRDRGLGAVDGRLTFLNMGQLAAYLAPETDQETDKLNDVERASAWKGAIIKEVNDYATIPGRLNVFTGEQGLGNVDAGVNSAIDLANRAGLDLELVGRTAERLRSLEELTPGAGHLAMAGAGVDNPTDYSAMFS